MSICILKGTTLLRSNILCTFKKIGLKLKGKL